MNENERRTYATQIRRLRTDRGLTRSALATESGVAMSSLAEIEAGHSVPTGDTLCKLFVALDVEPTSFGLMARYMADYLAVIAPLVQQIPRERMAEVMGEVIQIFGAAARGADLPMSRPVATQVNVTAGDADIDQTN